MVFRKSINWVVMVLAATLMTSVTPAFASADTSTQSVIARAERFAPITPIGTAADLPTSVKVTTGGARASISQDGLGAVTLVATDTKNSVVRQSGMGVQGITVLKSGDTASFVVNLPPGQKIIAGPGGSLVITDGRGMSGFVKPGWAIDRVGRSLPTRYVIDGSRIVQKVDTSRAQHPIVVDPWVSWGGPWYAKFVNVNLWKTDVAWLARNADYWSLMSALCGYMAPAGPGAVAACAIFVGASWIWIRNTMAGVASWGGCFYFSFYLPAAWNGWRGTYRSMGGFGC